MHSGTRPAASFPLHRLIPAQQLHVKSAKDEQKKALEKEQKEKSNKADKLKKKIQAIEPELIAAQNKYNDIYNKIGADWTYNQHKQIDTRPSEEEFKKVISNYLSWKINEILKNE